MEVSPTPRSFIEIEGSSSYISKPCQYGFFRTRRCPA